MWTRLQPESNYLTDCAKGASNVETFIELIFCRIVDFVDKPSFDDIYTQRKSLLTKLKLQVPQVFWTVTGHTTKLNAIRVMTDLSAKEKETIFSLIQGYDYGRKEEIITILQIVYPALANYLLYDGDLEVDDFDAIHVKIDVQELGIDMLSASAHKFNGPKGIGFLYIRRGTRIIPYADGGAQENQHRAGTENVASIVGMATALKENCVAMSKNTTHIQGLEHQLIDALHGLEGCCRRRECVPRR